MRVGLCKGRGRVNIIITYLCVYTQVGREVGASLTVCDCTISLAGVRSCTVQRQNYIVMLPRYKWRHPFGAQHPSLQLQIGAVRGTNLMTKPAGQLL